MKAVIYIVGIMMILSCASKPRETSMYDVTNEMKSHEKQRSQDEFRQSMPEAPFDNSKNGYSDLNKTIIASLSFLGGTTAIVDAVTRDKKTDMNSADSFSSVSDEMTVTRDFSDEFVFSASNICILNLNCSEHLKQNITKQPDNFNIFSAEFPSFSE